MKFARVESHSELISGQTTTLGCTATERLLCACFRVSETTVKAAVAAGCGSIDAVTEQTHAGGGCTCCHRRIQKLIDQRT